jgi:hypothetical protein
MIQDNSLFTQSRDGNTIKLSRTISVVGLIATSTAVSEANYAVIVTSRSTRGLRAWISFDLKLDVRTLIEQPNLVDTATVTGRYLVTGGCCSGGFYLLPSLQGDLSGRLSGGFYRPPDFTPGFTSGGQGPYRTPNQLGGGFGRP